MSDTHVDPKPDTPGPSGWRTEGPSGPPPLDAPKPWRTEGLPDKQPTQQRPGPPMWRRLLV